jgi:uncharacterized protein (TIGR01777 family)
MIIVITGATGFLGTPLLKRLAREHELRVLARTPGKAAGLPGNPAVFRWAGESEPPPAEAFEGADAVINLAGEPVNGRFTPAHKRRVYDSRVLGTRRIFETLQGMPQRPAKFVSASAVGYYGERGDEVLTETSLPGTGFLADVCKDWEREAVACGGLGMAVTRVRIGIVLGPGGGALQAMLPPFKLGLGGPLAGGRGYMPWVHVDDLAELFAFALRPGAAVVYNGVGPEPVTNARFTKALGRTLRRPALVPVPRLALKAALGEMADVVLMSDRVVPKQALDEGFRFRYPTIEAALAAVLR